MRLRAHVIVHGRVQGVFYRVTTRREAQKRKITGWIKNLSNGHVEAIFEGNKERIIEIIDFCRKGPPLAKVTTIEVYWEKITGLYDTLMLTPDKDIPAEDRRWFTMLIPSNEVLALDSVYSIDDLIEKYSNTGNPEDPL